MECKEIVKDFAERTLVNIRIIEENVKQGKEAYEVTQLINSLLGLIVFPRERDINQIPEIPLLDLKADGWPCPKFKIFNDRNSVNNLRDLIKFLRNCVAHFNLEFLLSRGNEIDKIHIWNEISTRQGKKIKVQETTITIEELRIIAYKFAKLLSGRN